MKAALDPLRREKILCTYEDKLKFLPTVLRVFTESMESMKLRTAVKKKELLLKKKSTSDLHSLILNIILRQAWQDKLV